MSVEPVIEIHHEFGRLSGALLLKRFVGAGISRKQLERLLIDLGFLLFELSSVCLHSEGSFLVEVRLFQMRIYPGPLPVPEPRFNERTLQWRRVAEPTRRLSHLS